MEFEHFSGRQCIEVADQNMKTFLVTFNSLQQRTNLTRTSTFVPLGKSRTQVKSENPGLTFSGNDLQKRMSGACGIMPLVIRNFLTTNKPYRMIFARGPVGHVS